MYHLLNCFKRLSPPPSCTYHPAVPEGGIASVLVYRTRFFNLWKIKTTRLNRDLNPGPLASKADALTTRLAKPTVYTMVYTNIPRKLAAVKLAVLPDHDSSKVTS